MGSPATRKSPVDVVVIRQPAPFLHGSTLTGQTLLRAPDAPAIQRPPIDRRLSRTIGEDGRFSPKKVAQRPELVPRIGRAVARRRPLDAHQTGALAPCLAASSATHVVHAGIPELASGAVQNSSRSRGLGDRLDARERALVAESFALSADERLSTRLLGLIGVRFGVRQSSG